MTKDRLANVLCGACEQGSPLGFRASESGLLCTTHLWIPPPKGKQLLMFQIKFLGARALKGLILRVMKPIVGKGAGPWKAGEGHCLIRYSKIVLRAFWSGFLTV